MRDIEKPCRDVGTHEKATAAHETREFRSHDHRAGLFVANCTGNKAPTFASSPRHPGAPLAAVHRRGLREGTGVPTLWRRESLSIRVLTSMSFGTHMQPSALSRLSACLPVPDGDRAAVATGQSHKHPDPGGGL
jgi:hypothetical protein